MVCGSCGNKEGLYALVWQEVNTGEIVEFPDDDCTQFRSAGVPLNYCDTCPDIIRDPGPAITQDQWNRDYRE